MSMKTTNLGDTLDSAAPASYAAVELLNNNTEVAVQYVVVGDLLSLVANYEGSLDGSTWGVIETHTFTADEITALSAFRLITNKPTPFFRITIATMTATTAATVTTLVRYDD